MVSRISYCRYTAGSLTPVHGLARVSGYLAVSTCLVCHRVLQLEVYSQYRVSVGVTGCAPARCMLFALIQHVMAVFSFRHYLVFRCHAYLRSGRSICTGRSFILTDELSALRILVVVLHLILGIGIRRKACCVGRVCLYSAFAPACRRTAVAPFFEVVSRISYCRYTAGCSVPVHGLARLSNYLSVAFCLVCHCVLQLEVYSQHRLSICCYRLTPLLVFIFI